RGCARLLRSLVRTPLALACRGAATRVIVQNDADFEVFERLLFVAPERLRLIPGSGVDLDVFRPIPEPAAPPVVAVCASRMLWDKGIGELVEAARRLHRKGILLRVRLVGGTDANPRSIPEDRLDAWAAEGVVEVAGRSEDVAGEYARAHLAVLPTYYGEGVPKALLEAAACARPMVTTDSPGCCDVCRHGETGLLVPPRDPAALAAALARLAGDAELRQRLGRNARALAQARFSDRLVASRTLELYARVLDPVLANECRAGRCSTRSQRQGSR
ncbi:MAG: glycosyltransferase, partial [Pseudomonadota bacterium]